jgi:hypothetical protein
MPPFVLGDSLVVAGPLVGGGSPSWESRLWFRIARKGPGQDAIGAYGAWKTRLAGDPEMEFVSALMDSAELSTGAYSNRFASYFHEEDSGFNAGFPDLSDGNEILPDDVFTAGLKIEYFITSNYVGETDTYFLPDTTGGTFLDFEILPSMRDLSAPGTGVIGFPCVLYVDAYNRGAEKYIQGALDLALPDIPGPGPNGDRYDEVGASTNVNGSSFFRTIGGNNGATLYQLLNYRVILVNTGGFSPGVMEEWDMIGLEEWLHTTECNISDSRQGLIMNGDQIVKIVETLRPTLLTESLGALFHCSPYYAEGCPTGAPADSSGCAQILTSDGAVYPLAEDLWAWGTFCQDPIFAAHDFTVLSPSVGVGNRSYYDYDESGPKGIVDYAQVVHDQSGDLANYRSIIDGFSYHHITNEFDEGSDLCVPSESGIIGGAAAEIEAALEWTFREPSGVCVPIDCGLVSAPDVLESGVRVNRLYQNRPNPFNPRTTLRFSVAARSKVELLIYDVSGRRVRSLVDQLVDPGLQQVVWDGTDDQDHNVSSGIYWSQLKVGDYVSSKKMIMLK